MCRTWIRRYSRRYHYRVHWVVPTPVYRRLFRPRRYDYRVFRMRQRRAVFIAGPAIEVEVEGRAGGEIDPTFGEGPEAQLGSLQVS